MLSTGPTHNWNPEIDNIVLFEDLFKQHYWTLLLFARKFITDEEQAKDIVQETFVALWEKRKEIKINTSVRAYLFRTVYNNCMNYLKHQKVKNKYRDNTRSSLREEEIRNYRAFLSGHGSLLEKDMKKEIQLAIESIPDKYKKTFKMSRIFHLKNKEISEILDIPVRTVETHLYRSLKYLRDKLKHHFPVF